MIQFRPFRNCDPPALAEIWRSQPQQRGLAQPMTTALLEELVFSKLYFDHRGLIVAEDGQRLVGFSHAGFGIDSQDSSLDHEMGVTCVLMTLPEHRLSDTSPEEVGAGLIRESEAFLRDNGSKVLYAGGIQPLNPFYFSIYGGSELPGVLSSDHRALSVYQAAGYREIDQVAILHRELRDFRAPFDRHQMKIRREYAVVIDPDPLYNSWWGACNYTHLARTLCVLRRKSDGAQVGIADFWNMDTMSSNWGVRAIGLSRLEIDTDLFRQGLGTFLVGEVLKYAQSEGASLVEVQTMQSNTAALALYAKLGFQQVDQGLVLRKEG